MQSIDTYIKESILSSTRAGKYALLDKVMKNAHIKNYALEVLPGHNKESIVIDNTDKSWQDVLNFEKSGIDAIKTISLYDGILMKMPNGKYAYPDYMYFGNFSNCDVDLSFFDFSDANIGAYYNSINNYITIRFTNCNNINIVELPYCYDSTGKYVNIELWSTSLSGFTNNNTNNALENMCEDGKPLIMTDLSVFKYCRFKSIKITENYFKLKCPEEYGECITELPDRKYVKNCFNEQLDKFVEDCVVYSSGEFRSNKKSPVDILTKYNFKNLRKSNKKEYKYMLV